MRLCQSFLWIFDSLLHFLRTCTLYFADTFQFATTAPTGVMSIKSFSETFENMVSVTHGMEQLPDVWLNISQQQVSSSDPPPTQVYTSPVYGMNLCCRLINLKVCTYVAHKKERNCMWSFTIECSLLVAVSVFRFHGSFLVLLNYLSLYFFTFGHFQWYLTLRFFPQMSVVYWFNMKSSLIERKKNKTKKFKKEQKCVSSAIIYKACTIFFQILKL